MRVVSYCLSGTSATSQISNNAIFIIVVKEGDYSINYYKQTRRRQKTLKQHK
jgi:hypothetical protein